MESAVLTPDWVCCACPWQSIGGRPVRCAHSFSPLHKGEHNTSSVWLSQQKEVQKVRHIHTRDSKECTPASYFLWWVPFPEVTKTATAARDPIYTTWACGDAAHSDSDIQSPDPKGSGHLIMKNASGLPPKALKVSTIPTLFKSPSVK